MHVRNATRWRPSLAGGLFALLVAAACVTTEESPPAPPFAVAAEHFTGSVFSGALAESPSLDGEPWWIDLSVAFLEVMPVDGGEPLTAYTRQVFVEGSDDPLRTRGELARGTTLGVTNDPLAEVAWQEGTTEALWPGTTLRLVVTHDLAYELEHQAPWDELALEISRSRTAPEEFELALAFGTLGAEDARAVREHVVLEGIDLLGGLRLFVPSPCTETPGSAGVLELARVEPPASVARAARARGEANLTAARARVTQESEHLDPAGAFRFERTRALEALARGPLRRSALLYLSDSSGAQVAGELALLADEETLSAFLAEVERELASTEEIEDAEEFGWFLERTTYRWLAALAADPERELAPELDSLLVRQAGELGRYPDLVVETVGECRDLLNLKARFLEENRIFLEDSHPAARVRAYDWLAARSAAPAGYDPLASRAARREALAENEKKAP